MTLFQAVEGRMDQEAVVQIMLLAWLLAVVTLFVRHAGVDDPLDFDFAYQSPFTRMLRLPGTHPARGNPGALASQPLLYSFVPAWSRRSGSSQTSSPIAT
jgi:hypothetical protein